ncbi:uncharacterized protein LOC116187055 [Punica granatum]|uniref:Uncharacterized protein n=2 Tax=Punica granatum TaxID=22663 RepID=A0A218XRR7_PUNGR|nr:uncharacterized protein LOC116187055 [Punica granatum]OWM87488.1 hypothetical protein CDL15_Pgr022599 [Punica granatum]PKI46568.1 hypothetical protein CRG98_032910 [Punica granatum]
MDCTVCMAAGNNFFSRVGGLSQIGGGFSHESEHDLAVMVSDFLENGGSGGRDSWCSSDSDSGFSDLAQLADNILFHKRLMDQHESDLQSVVHSLILSISENDLQFVKAHPCNATCIRFTLVKLLRCSGYDAAVCSSRWPGTGKVPGGDHEYIDVVHVTKSGITDRLIIDIDFQSHFEIARAVASYDRILKSLPVVYVGSLSRLNQFLQVMAEAARFSLKQNSMPLPPWRSLAYLQAKWHSQCTRQLCPDSENILSTNISDHKQCSGHLKMLHAALLSEIEAERLLKPKKVENNNSSRRLKLERRRYSYFRTL